MFRWGDEYFKSGLNGGALAKKLASVPNNGCDTVESNGRSEDLLEKEQTLLMTP